jgi:hypothetical protein
LATPTSGTSVAWDIKASARGDGGVLDHAWGTEVEVVDTFLAEDYEHISNATGAVTINGAVAGALISFQIRRNTAVAGNINTPAALLGVNIQFSKNTVPAGW